MKKSNKMVIQNNTDGSITLFLRTGQVTIPSLYGGYIVSTKCGSGKTTAIKEIIATHYNDGIVYCVDTIESLNEIRDFIIDKLINPGYITEADMAYITADTKSDIEMYHDHPEQLTQKRIILCTHVRFFSSLIDYLLICQTNLPGNYYFDGDFFNLMQRTDLRKWILFDETPLFIRPFCTLQYSIMGSFSETKPDGSIGCKSLLDIHTYYDHFIRDSAEDPFKHRYVVDEIQKDVVLSLIPKLYGSFINRQDKKKPIEIEFKPSDLVQPGMQTHVIVFEGVGNILLEGTRFQLLQTPEAYQAHVNFRKFQPFKLMRKDTTKGQTDNLVNDLVSLISHHKQQKEKVLVIVWKNVGREYDGSENTSTKSSYAPYIEQQLRDRLQDGFAVTYYGSALTKSVNLFRDYQAIVLVGKWSIPTNETERLRQHWNSNTSNLAHNLWYYIQLISRIGIRNHQPGNYYVYYTEDHNPKLMNDLEAYFHNRYQPTTRKVNDWEAIVANANIQIKTKEKIKLLIKQYPDLQTLIVQQQKSSYKEDFRIKQADIEKLFPKEKKVGHLRSRIIQPFLEILNGWGINLIFDKS